MLTAAPGAPRPTPPTGSTWRSVGAPIALAVLLLSVLLFFAARGGKPEPSAGSRSTAPADGRDAPTRPKAPASRASAPAPKASARRGPVRASAEPAEAPPELKAADVSDPALKAVLVARDDRSPEATRVLIDSLTSRDDVVVAEAAKALVARSATEAIAPLAAIGLEKAAGSGLSVIDALGKLAGAAEGEEKNAAVDRLLAMLKDEKRRAAPESPGNLLQIYEALGDTHDPRAAPALEAELLDAEVPRAPKVVIVHALVDIGLASSKAAITTAHDQQTAQREDDAFEEEIRKELVTALEEAAEAL